ncbi:hypothetical protein [Erythrobacter crassostreae]|uniref:Uncharacterized protein n=1 Tax=Erythrobacter crassostreae TaxID=2828328 RepID=A0A9X1F2U7_9SPHN|nr:hypothetical protein [Erythrobacter crassostrea]MBV7259037.1 hypothetical protein [Erythrobacter crassostrea]
MKTRPAICNRKKRYATREAAEDAADAAPFKLRAYACELCRKFHLTSRTKGMKTPRRELERKRNADQAGQNG